MCEGSWLVLKFMGGGAVPTIARVGVHEGQVVRECRRTLLGKSLEHFQVIRNRRGIPAHSATRCCPAAAQHPPWFPFR